MAQRATEDLSRLALDLVSGELAGPARRSGARDAQLARLEAMGGALAAAGDVAQSVEHIVNATTEVIRLGTLVEAELERVRLETGYKRERLAAVAPGAIRVLEGLGARIEKLVDGVMRVDVARCSEAELRWRNRLVDLADRHAETLHAGLMKLLS